MLAPGERVELAVERPAGGGRMIARHDGQIVLVQGAIPGERVVAEIERVERRLAFAAVVDVLEPSPDRREGAPDPRCGGCLYSHIAYPRQLSVKADVIRDAFVRLGRIPLESGVDVAGSPERGYRMRARFHVRGGRAGFYREGTHELCDPSITGQLADDAIASVAAMVEMLRGHGVEPQAVELTENIARGQRAASVQLHAGARFPDSILDGVLDRTGLTGCVVHAEGRAALTAGTPVVSDPLAALTRGRARDGDLSRHVESFFQANRFLIADLVTGVLDAVAGDGEAGDVLDLYAGVGLFSVSLASVGGARITAVEGDRSSGADLRRNAAPFGPAVRVMLDSVERYLASNAGPPRTVIVDPPRTGISKEAVAALIRRRAARIVYVSCDPATMARDARRLLDAGYLLGSLRGFDLFPNTPHVELLGVFVLA